MSRVVPGQFDDADSSDSENIDLKIVKEEDDIVFEDLRNNVKEKMNEGEIEEGAEEEDDDDDDEDWDWDDGVGKLTRGRTWAGGSNLQVRCMCAVYFHVYFVSFLERTFYGAGIE